MKIKKTKFGDYERVVKFPVIVNYFVHVVFTENIARSRKGRYGTEGAAEGRRHCPPSQRTGTGIYSSSLVTPKELSRTRRGTRCIACSSSQARNWITRWLRITSRILWTASRRSDNR
jgi:hypothetical protein